MTESQFACPHCQGIIKVASSMAGNAVRCPLCSQAFQVPMSPDAQAQAPNGGQPAAPADDRLKFACPQCNNPFQVPLSSLGKAVACPGCKSPVQLPTVADYAASQSQDVQPSSGPPHAAPSRPNPSPIESLPDIVARDHPAPLSQASQGNDAQSTEEKSTRVPETINSTPSRPKTVDDLLPPKFSRRLPQVATNAAALDGVILHEPVRKVQTGGQTRNLVVVSDEVKSRRRLIRNAIMFSLGSLLLVVAAKLLIR